MSAHSPRISPASAAEPQRTGLRCTIGTPLPAN